MSVRDLEQSKSILPILGMYKDGKLTVDGYLERKREEKKLEEGITRSCRQKMNTIPLKTQ
ncbi:MAG: hypothetical protein FWG87_11050 [Defluviitaleaceae bacterium]|nr:hypothetical protein [Defluviitaleaceae bacterium]